MGLEDKLPKGILPNQWWLSDDCRGGVRDRLAKTRQRFSLGGFGGGASTLGEPNRPNQIIAVKTFT